MWNMHKARQIQLRLLRGGRQPPRHGEMGGIYGVERKYLIQTTRLPTLRRFVLQAAKALRVIAVLA